MQYLVVKGSCHRVCRDSRDLGRATSLGPSAPPAAELHCIAATCAESLLCTITQAYLYWLIIRQHRRDKCYIHSNGSPVHSQ
jgi:hypothetical protein